MRHFYLSIFFLICDQSIAGTTASPDGLFGIKIGDDFKKYDTQRVETESSRYVNPAKKNEMLELYKIFINSSGQIWAIDGSTSTNCRSRYESLKEYLGSKYGIESEIQNNDGLNLRMFPKKNSSETIIFQIFYYNTNSTDEKSGCRTSVQLSSPSYFDSTPPKNNIPKILNSGTGL
jgi:hypothetical protein